LTTENSNTTDRLDLAQLYRAESGRILSVLMLQTRDLSLAEDALQDAFVQAHQQWESIPRKSAAWLLTVARRRLIDRLRKEQHKNHHSTLQAIVDIKSTKDLNKNEYEEFPDERLRLIFTCTHPALAENSRVPLTLKTLCGLSTRELARAYLISEPAMEQRLTRAKRKIRDAGISYEVPESTSLIERLNSVLSVIYLIYNESYSAFEGSTLTRNDLAEEAIRLARLLKQLLPNPEVDGLLALLLLHDSRRSARTSGKQSFIALEHQNRNDWDQNLISEGVELISASLKRNLTGPYQIQAAISALHALAPSWEKTDWSQIKQLYDVMMTINPSPIITLNRAVAIAYAGNINLALKQLMTIESQLKNYQPFYAARAELNAQSGNVHTAIEDYKKAIQLTSNNAESTFLKSKLIKINDKD